VVSGILARRDRGAQAAASPAAAAPTAPAPDAGPRPVRRAPSPGAARPAPALVWSDPRVAPKTGSFAPNARANGTLHRHDVPVEADGWDRLEEFALTYDGYAYWEGLPEVAQTHLSAWTRDGSLPATLDQQRACLFYEQRRWHHFGDVPSGRSLDYLWSIAAAIRAGLDPAPIAVDAPADGAVDAVGDPLPVVQPGAATSEPTPFVDDDAGFLAWLAGNPDGLVLNVERHASARTPKLHRSSCSTLAGAPGRTWTVSYRKVCGSDRDTLDGWARREIGAGPDPCKRCKP
jgi:hypothetical protein